jgi:beta-lactam-binding protein with PASTA domain
VKGKSVDVARQILQDSDLNVSTQGEPELGIVQKQDVAPGTKVKRGTTITLTIV